MDSGFILYETVEEMPLPILPYFSREPVCKKISLVGQVLIPFVAGKTKSEDVTKYSTTAFFEVNLDYTSADIDEDTIEQLLALYNKGVSKVFASVKVAEEIKSRIPNARLVYKISTPAEASAVNGAAVAFTKTPSSPEAVKPFSKAGVYVFVNRSLDSNSITAWAKSPATVVIDSSLVTTEYEHPAAGKTPLIEYIVAGLTTDRPDGLYTTVAVNPEHQALGIAYSSKQSIAEAFRRKAGVYQSRTRGLWVKGLTSGNTQELYRVDVDCDGDAIQFVVEQKGAGFCHKETSTCFGQLPGLANLEAVLKDRVENAPEGSYTKRLLNNRKMLDSKIREEADELIDANTKSEIAWEAADLFYFALVKCAKNGVTLADIEKNLEAKSLRVTRRKGDAKPKYVAETEEHDRAKKEKEEQERKRKAAEAIDPEAPIILKRVDADTASAGEIAACLKRPIHTSKDIMSLVTPIVEKVKNEGDKALLELTQKFDHVSLKSPMMSAPFPESAMQITEDVRRAIDIAFENVRKFHEAQFRRGVMKVETCPGVVCSRFARPIERVGCYVPGGTAVLPSTSLMLSVPALVAGCKDIVFASPPGKNGKLTPEVVYVAHKVGAKGIVMAGGAQAVAALAYGTETIPKCDKIMGPGNQFVTAAKMLVSNDSAAMCAIDMPAGPSEVLVMADEFADTDFVASDLLSQAEHGVDSQVLCIAVNMSQKKLDELDKAVDSQAKRLPRVAIVRKCIVHSTTLQVKTYAEAFEMANRYAPEHLILQIKDAAKWVDSVNNAGSVFVGAYSPESCGDYASGTNHTLPTYGYARMYSGVNTATFQKFITSQVVTPEGLKSIGKATMDLAAVEGLDAHRNAVKIRMEKLGLYPPSN